MRRRTRSLVAALLLVVTVSGTALAVSGTALAVPVTEGDHGGGSPVVDPSPTADSTLGPSYETIVVEYAVDRRPTDVGTVEVTATAHLPARVSRFEFTPPDDATVTDRGDYDPGGENEQFHWEGGREHPSMTYTVSVHEDRIERGFGDYQGWALMDDDELVGDFHYWWASGDNPGSTTRLAIATDEPGVAGEEYLYVGDHETASAGNVTLVIPETATLETSPHAILSSIQQTRDELALGDRGQQVTVFVAPRRFDRSYVSDNHVPEMVVTERAAVNATDNTWAHEFVHLRQHYEPTPAMAWLDEGSAEYYESLMPFRQRRVSFDDFHGAVTIASGSTADLTDPGARRYENAEYDKGAQIVAAIDAHIRAATDGDRSFRDVLRRLNRHDGPVDVAVFRDAVADVGNESIADDAVAWIHGDAPAVPDDPRLFVANPGDDPDGDGLTTGREYRLGTAPLVEDTDADGVPDAAELDLGSDPLVTDTDGDGLRDGRDVELGVDPTVADTDGDGLADGVEPRLGTDPTTADTDGDGYDDRAEFEARTDPTRETSDLAVLVGRLLVP